MTTDNFSHHAYATDATGHQETDLSEGGFTTNSSTTLCKNRQLCIFTAPFVLTKYSPFQVSEVQRNRVS
ncbi:hypothetical protein [Argonema antarcticum]|uniref:hypothetical protein n=1 Tax=Argonema antarcticum TaxID=2942763 RepID=UPI0020135373|nr:hypothetical protein [Argonema antarcticum]MCL1472605.1 hypothetical protein [Argonema antarcticum A004/B2]